MSKHTPGPWVARMEAGSWGVSRISMMDVCVMNSDYEGTEGDAYLCSAAPELLASCKELVDVIESAMASDPVTPRERTLRRLRAHAAIAKAEGEE